MHSNHKDPERAADMLLPVEEQIRLGREVVVNGDLKKLREAIGLTRFAMAELLYVAWPTYAKWEKRPVTLRKETAARVGRFYHQASQQLAQLKEEGINLNDMIPFHVAATLLGIPQEQLLRRYREGQFAATDVGILGLWLDQSDLDELRS